MSGAPRPGAPGPGEVRRPLRLTRRGRIVAAVTLALLTLGVLWIGGRIDTVLAGERAGERIPSRIAAYAGDTAPGRAAGGPMAVPAGALRAH